MQQQTTQRNMIFKPLANTGIYIYNGFIVNAGRHACTPWLWIFLICFLFGLLNIEMFLLYLFDRLKKTKYLLILPEIVIADNFLYSLPVLPSYQLGCSDGFRSLPLYVMMKWRAEDSSNPVQFLLPWCSRVSEYCYPGTESVTGRTTR